MLTKNDLSKIKTVVQETIKPEIKALSTEIKTLKQSMSTKGDMNALEVRLKGDINNMATKADLKTLESRLIEKIDDAQMEIIAAVDKHKADKESVKVLEKRVERLEDNAGLPTHVD